MRQSKAEGWAVESTHLLQAEYKLYVSATALGIIIWILCDLKLQQPYFVRILKKMTVAIAGTIIAVSPTGICVGMLWLQVQNSRARLNFCQTLCDFGTQLQCHGLVLSEHGLPSPHFIFTTMWVSLLLLQPCFDKLQILDSLDSSVKVMLWEMMSVIAASNCCCTA